MDPVMVSAAGCGCCCLAVVFVVGAAAILGVRRKKAAMGSVPGVADAPARGSSTNARLTYMDEPLQQEPATVQLRPLPKVESKPSQPSPAVVRPGGGMPDSPSSGPSTASGAAGKIPPAPTPPAAKPPFPPTRPIAPNPPVATRSVVPGDPPGVPPATVSRPPKPASVPPPIPPDPPPGPRVIPAAPTAIPSDDDWPPGGPDGKK